MKNRQISHRYATALFRLDPQGKYDEMFSALAEAFRASSVLMQAIMDPMIPAALKLNALGKSLEGSLPEFFAKFLGLLAEKRRLDYLPAILDDYLLQRARKNQQIYGSIVSSIPLTTEQLKRIETEIGNRYSKNCTLSPSVDESLIGGFMVLVEGTVYDSSVRSQLEGIRNRFLNLAG